MKKINQVELVASLTKPFCLNEERLALIASKVAWGEVRADLIPQLDLVTLKSQFSGKLIYALRSQEEGGAFTGSLAERHHRLIQAASHFDLIELEGERDLLPAVLEKIPPSQRIIAHLGTTEAYAKQKERLENYFNIDARFYKMLSGPSEGPHVLTSLELLHTFQRNDLIAFAEGASNYWTRLIAPHLGAPLVYGNLEKASKGEGEPTLQQTIEDYDYPHLHPLKELYGMVGNPVYHSLSPKLHNAAYRQLKLPALYVPFQTTSFSEFWKTIEQADLFEKAGIPFKGLTIVSPFKEEALKVVRYNSYITRQTGATNLFIRSHGYWKAESTDPPGILTALREQRFQVPGAQVAIIGCGGSGRSVAATLDAAGAKVTMFNRGNPRGYFAQKCLGLPFVALSDFTGDGFDLIVNATPVGRDGVSFPFSLERVNKSTIIVDMVYGKHPTPLVKQFRQRGGIAIEGKDILRIQIQHQFRLMVGQEMPECILYGTLSEKNEPTGLLSVG